MEMSCLWAQTIEEKKEEKTNLLLEICFRLASSDSDDDAGADDVNVCFGFIPTTNYEETAV